MPAMNQIHRNYFVSLLNNQGRRPSIDLWDAVKGSQQGNEAHSFFIRITETRESDLSESDSIKLGDKLIPVPRTFSLLIGNI